MKVCGVIEAGAKASVRNNCGISVTKKNINMFKYNIKRVIAGVKLLFAIYFNFKILFLKRRR